MPVAKGEGFMPIESPDGQVVYFVRQTRLWSVRTDGTAEREVGGMPESIRPDAWTPVQSGIYFMGVEGHFIGVEGQKWAIEFFDLHTKKSRVLYVLEKDLPDWAGGLPVSSDGKWLLFPQVDERSSDLMMVENWR